jgi:hypothetical protein
MLPAGNKAKKLAALDIVNVSFKIYFRLNTLRLCKNLMRTVDSPQFASFDQFPISQRVTYKFYAGRLAVFDEKYVSFGSSKHCSIGSGQQHRSLYQLCARPSHPPLPPVLRFLNLLSIL